MGFQKIGVGGHVLVQNADETQGKHMAYYMCSLWFVFTPFSKSGNVTYLTPSRKAAKNLREKLREIVTKLTAISILNLWKRNLRKTHSEPDLVAGGLVT